MYLLGSVCAESKVGSAINETQKTIGSRQELKVAHIRFVVSLLAYIVCAAMKSTGHVVFFAPRREKPNASYLHPLPLPVVCKGFSMPLRAWHLHGFTPALFTQDGAP